MKELILKITEYKNYQLTDGEYSEYCSLSKKDGQTILYKSDNYNRLVFTTKKWREHCSGSLELEDFEKEILVKGKESLVFNIVEDECVFGYRSGKVVYTTSSNKFKIIVEEVYEWDE